MNVPMPHLARIAVDVCRLRRGPQDLPYSPHLLLTLIVVSTGLDLLAGTAQGDSASSALGRSLLSNVSVLGLCWVALAIRHLHARYVQTATALVACSLLFSLIQTSLTLLAGPLPDAHTPLTGLQGLISWIALTLFVWEIGVDVHIMRHAMESSFVFALLLVISWVVVYWTLASALLPQPAHP
ncbi:MAG: hypothetical protein LBQ20_01575 [Rhodanobacter sp.]|nr:hypothetical protein [Rhodanobacter sp.]